MNAIVQVMNADCECQYKIISLYLTWIATYQQVVRRFEFSLGVFCDLDHELFQLNPASSGDPSYIEVSSRHI
jgi:hypothetical protein